VLCAHTVEQECPVIKPPRRAGSDPEACGPEGPEDDCNGSQEVPPDYNGRILTSKATLTSGIGVFYNEFPLPGKPHQDRWSWNNGTTPPDQFFMWGPTTSPSSASNFLVTAAQFFTGTAANITPTVGTGGLGYQVKLGTTLIGYGAIYPGAGTAQWWMYKYSTFDTIVGPGYYPDPTNTQPLFFVRQPATSGQGWVGVDI